MSTTVRPIRLDEVSTLQEFVREQWNPEHAFVRSRELLLWQHHLNPFKQLGAFGTEDLSFWGAWDDSGLVAVLGEIPVPFAIREQTVPGTWLALWKNRAESKHMGVGIQLMRGVTTGPAAFVGGIGVNERVLRAYQLFRFQLFDDLPIHVVLNPDVSSAWVRKKATFSEARGSRFLPRMPVFPSSPGFTVRPLPAEAGEWDRFWARTRTNLVGTDRCSAYIEWRYHEHPHYQYEWISVYGETGDLEAAGVYRVEEAEGEKTLHVVEFLGDGQPAERLAHALCNEMRERKASFLGFRCSRQRCFDPWRAVGGDVYANGDLAYELPSLFQPVVPEYRALKWAHRFGNPIDPATLAELYVTRSDSDQDRPSQIRLTQ